MSWVATAITSSVINAGASIYGAKKGADAMESAANKSNAIAREIYGQQRADAMPYTKSGYNALNALNRLYGLPGVDTSVTSQGTGPGGLRPTQKMLGKKMVYVDDQGNGFVFASKGENAGEQYPAGYYEEYDLRKTNPQPAGSTGNTPPTGNAEQDRYGGFYASPGYQFRMDEGVRAYDRSAAARGRLLSGAQVKAQTRYGQGVASDEFLRYSNALANIAGLGQVSGGAVMNAASNYGANAANAAMNSGMARASGYLGTAGAIGNTANAMLGALPYLRPGGNNIAASQQAGYAAPGTGGFMPIRNPF